jgi:hypothetical protein
VTIVAPAPPAFDEYNKTFPVVEISGNIDQKHPFNVPLTIKDRSSIFDLHNVKANCAFSIIWKTPTGTMRAHGLDGYTYSTVLITPQDPFFFVSEFAAFAEMRESDTGALMPIQKGTLIVTIKYKTQLLPNFAFAWGVNRELVILINAERGPNGLHWIVGRQIFGHRTK